MYNQLFSRWIPLLCLLLVVVAGVSLGQKNSHLVHKNNALVLQNDSILSVNLQLSKELSKLQSTLDSVRMNSASASRLRLPD
ncbi:hypothetical protein [Paraflavitalea pollutisoli]|uniref:hypothetical protein n=1 Tax=Paraflavitalea pollutisoli TaxID=3034143 RepID=UPI0023EBEC8F|nr:hypothetical protein [Paraflavitalea sp. H1-2-19X]